MLETNVHQENKRQGIVWLSVNWETSQDLLSSNSAARHNKAIAT